ncbi:AbrB/MazE/SpoVT family DNA-binding domain-containing protein [Nocardia asiatica]|uniref:AbrB/MazE/SpoVT family DNA-binding domain-containing protein n=1 Tax=Nocardia asiatica TaxID=209252 RepID=UPI0002E4CCDC|nr:AbrB/MazE/SpoVT family DNA-binding domain-containing protein [Nocardia asiatica]
MTHPMLSRPEPDYTQYHVLHVFHAEGSVRSMTKEQAASYGPGGRGFYGAVTVSERGQIAIPAQARRDHGISPGDKLLVLGDPEQGLALMKLEVLLRNLHGSSELLQQILNLSGTDESERKTDHA